MCEQVVGSSLAFAIEMEIGVREKEFGIFLSEKFSSTKRGTCGVFYKDFGEKIKANTLERRLKRRLWRED